MKKAPKYTSYQEIPNDLKRWLPVYHRLQTDLENLKLVTDSYHYKTASQQQRTKEAWETIHESLFAFYLEIKKNE